MPIPVDPRHYGLLNPDGSNLAQAITFLRDKDEDAYNLLRAEMQRWIPEYDIWPDVSKGTSHNSKTARNRWKM